MNGLTMPPLRTRSLLLVLLSVGLLYYSSDRLPLSSNFRGLKIAPDSHRHHDDAGSISTAAVARAGEVLLVSAFFPLNESRHSDREYEKFLGTFLGSIQSPIHFFTPPEIAPLVRRKRGSLPITINSSYADPFDVPPVQGLYHYYDKMRRWQNKDRETEGPGLYALRTAKPWFLTEAVKNYERELASGSQSIRYAFWVDVGSFYDGLKVRGWPNVERVESAFREGAETTGRSEGELIFFPMNDVPNPTMQWWKEDMGPLSRNFAQTSFFGGTPNAIEWWKRVYLKYHDYWLFNREAFVGQDETMFNSLSLLFPGRIITVWPRDPHAPAALGDKADPLGVCGNLRWYFRYFFASRTERRRLGAFFKSRVWRMPWQIFSPVEECRLTRVLGMEDVLRRNFGAKWDPPKAELDLNADYRPKPQ
ncbi:hypothetical protein BJ322DRAFT_1067874 [Thelephora terrestris]|uniref:Uncharacterized protein n=1 Tax=Thelephora terrestris TaxID=56493 RepID=A0A9P6L664_9AGAM|nr:hypothetical protein BJ322DRAFT_1067874 [Thelephora terrestris]